MSRKRGGAFLVGCGAVLIFAPAWVPPLPHGGWTKWWLWLQSDPQSALALFAGCAGWLLAAWLLLVMSLTLISAGAGAAGRLSARAAAFLTPQFARRLLEALLGTALVIGSASPALAGAAPVAVSAGALSSLAPVPAPVVAPPPLPPLLNLDRPDVTAARPAASPPRPSPLTAPAGPPPARHAVRPGETLWGLAADRLPAGSSAQQITRAWQQWYVANRQQIGPDPGLLLVGEILLIPAARS